MEIALTIAGSDSGGGAGIQADLKTFQRFDVFGTSALTLVTAQNTRGVQQVHLLPPDVVIAQIASVASDLRPRAAKTGALGSAAIIEAVAVAVGRWEIGPLVVDPVMTSKHGDALLAPDAVEALRRHLFPRATLLTPNLHEAQALLGTPVPDERAMGEAARALAALGPAAVLVKGGALQGEEAVDVLFDGERLHRFATRRQATRNTHGTGCTFSAAITALLARGRPMPDAIAEAKAWLDRAIANAPNLGSGQGPLDHAA